MNSTARDASLDTPIAGAAGSVPAVRSLRWRLLVLAAAGLLPLALAAAAAMFHVVKDRERAVQDAALVTARSIAAAVQFELESVIAVLDTLGSADSIAEGRLDRFGTRARLVAETRGWRAVTLADASGQLLFSTTARRAQETGPVDPDSLRLAIERRAPVVGALVEGPRRQGPAFAVRVPLVRDGQVRYVLSGVIGSEHVLELVRQQQLPESHVVAIFDATGARIARTLENSVRGPSPSLQVLLDHGGLEGAGPTRTLEGQAVHTGYRRVEGPGWVVAVGIAAGEANRAIMTSLLAALLGLLASLALSAWLAWYFARKVSQPIAQLKQAAAALGRGEAVRAHVLDIEELQEVGAALELASREREQAAAEREGLLAQATDALRRAEEAARAKDEFLAVLGHELRNPLAPIASALRLMDLKGEQATRTERGIVERQLGYMTRLVDDLLDVSRITGRKLAIQRKPLAVGPWIDQGVEAVRASLGGRRLQVDVPDAVAGSWVLGDAVRLAQVLNNLLGNAVKFTAETGRIDVSARRRDRWLEIDVADDGVGMTADELRCAFDVFYQAPQAQHRSRAGLGLGLSIVHSLVEMHGGTVQAHSAGRHQGSRFTLRLPCAEAPASTPGQPSLPSAPAPQVSGRVLVVDDNRDAADTAGTLLEVSGFSVRVAYSPREALDALDAFPAQVGLLDIGLPEMDGYQLASAIRARPGGERIRLVALTGYGQDSDIRRAHASGFVAHMTKPVGPDALLELVGRLVRDEPPTPPAG